MITLDAMNAKLDALTAGMNSILATLEQGNKWAVERTEAIQKERVIRAAAIMDEIRKVREDLLAEKLLRAPLLCGKCNKDFDHCKCSVFETKPRPTPKRSAPKFYNCSKCGVELLWKKNAKKTCATCTAGMVAGPKRSGRGKK